MRGQGEGQGGEAASWENSRAGEDADFVFARAEAARAAVCLVMTSYCARSGVGESFRCVGWSPHICPCAHHICPYKPHICPYKPHICPYAHHIPIYARVGIICARISPIYAHTNIIYARISRIYTRICPLCAHISPKYACTRIIPMPRQMQEWMDGWMDRQMFCSQTYPESRVGLPSHRQTGSTPNPMQTCAR